MADFPPDHGLPESVGAAERMRPLSRPSIDHDRSGAVLQNERTKRKALDALLPTIASALDIRTVLPGMSEVIKEVLPHDYLTLALLTADRRGATVHASTSASGTDRSTEYRFSSEAELAAANQRYYLVRDYVVSGDTVRAYFCPADAEQPSYLDLRPGAEWMRTYTEMGVRAELRVPIRLRQETVGGLSFASRDPDTYSEADVDLAERIADHAALALAHERLAEQARQTEELRSRTTALELLDALLASVTDHGDLNETFHRISSLVRKVLPHDALVLPVILPDRRHATLYATSGLDNTAPTRIDVPEAFLRDPDWEYKLIEDAHRHLDAEHVRLEGYGFRSSLSVPIRRDGEFIAGLAFCSRTPATYKQADILVGRRIADRLALSLAREQEEQAAKRADEASARASRLEVRVRQLTDELDARTGCRRVVGESPEWRHVLKQAAQVASTDATVLLLGESGTGKEVIARLIHRGSSRPDGPFVALNCAALPEQLLESELFGYERGAFTGAHVTRAGKIEHASGGILFLDEVAEMSPSVQAKFLRVLQEREFQRLGGTKILNANIRVIAATNREPRVAIERGTLREDLYYRLCVFEITLPTLRDRPKDILLLAEAFLVEIGKGMGRPAAGISEDAREQLLAHSWPGNVRELRNAIERAVILCEGGLVTGEHLPICVAKAPRRSATATGVSDTGSQPLPAEGVNLEEVERDLLTKALVQARNNKSQAAKLLGVPRGQFYSLLRRHGLTTARR